MHAMHSRQDIPLWPTTCIQEKCQWNCRLNRDAQVTPYLFNLSLPQYTIKYPVTTIIIPHSSHLKLDLKDKISININSFSHLLSNALHFLVDIS